MRLTAYGKLVRKRRIDEGITLNEMANALGVTPAFLSSIETGRKSVPDEIVDKAIDFLNMNAKESDELRRAAEVSRKEFKIKMPKGAGPQDKEIAALFARQFSSMTDEQKQQLKQLLEGRKA